MKLIEIVDNPANYHTVMRVLKTAEKAGMNQATVSFRTFDDRDYGGDLNGHRVEITIEGE